MYAYCHFVFFIIENVHALLYFAKRNLVYRGLLEYVVNARGSWFIMKDAPPPQVHLQRQYNPLNGTNTYIEVLGNNTTCILVKYIMHMRGHIVPSRVSRV